VGDRVPAAERLLRLLYGPRHAGEPYVEDDALFSDDPTVYRYHPTTDAETTTPLSAEDPEAWLVHQRVREWADG
jgi:hypothetical protein